ncbi:hypothetical protein [Methylobacterium organophilum]|uniref:Uncharacterized protein n=1 Tax=Methylobacterium organophilum TaxID=410 RepID=A0ABQ4T2H0_METOR|nr:hypothetical protein [Methylobacterium organophilum]GJE25830.1 hypothetical protein LKMONMHP_0673 [Methylobacterium organophilum]
MKKLNSIMAALALVATPAFAQQKTYNLQVTESDLVALSKYLGKAPYDEVAPIIQRLGAQVQRQAASLASQLASGEPQSKQSPQIPTIGSKAAAQGGQPVATKEGPKTLSPADMEAEMRAKDTSRPSIPMNKAEPADILTVPSAPTVK